VKTVNHIFLLILLLSIAYSSAAQTGKELDIIIKTYEAGKTAKDVTFTRYKNSKVEAEVVSKKGDYGFIIRDGESSSELVISKEGYLTKRIVYKTEDFPFEADYEFQEIDVEMIPVASEIKNIEYVRIMSYDRMAKTYSFDRLDTTSLVLKRTIKERDRTIDDVYQKAITNGDDLVEANQYKYAVGFYEVALVAKKDDSYAMERMTYADSMAKVYVPPTLIVEEVDSTNANGGSELASAQGFEESRSRETEPTSTNSTPQIGSYYSVQLGAFIDWYDKNVFADVPELNVVKSSDYKRCISGRFDSRDAAEARKNEMKDSGFDDAFIVQMKDNERIGF